MSFLIEKYINEIWYVHQRGVLEEWRARDLAKTEATPSCPTRVIDLNERKVLCCYTAGDVPPPKGWEHYGYATQEEEDETKMTTETNQPQTDQGTTTTAAPAPAPAEGSTPPAPAPVPTPAPAEGSTPPAPAPVPTPAPASVPATGEGVPPAVQELLENTDDEAEVPEEPIWKGNPYTGTPRVAMLFSGGLSSTATLLYLISKGYHVVPYYIFDENFEGSEREMKVARSIIRTARPTKRVSKLEVIETKLSKQHADRRRRRYIELLTKTINGLGFNAICYGKVPIEPGDDVDDDLAADTDVLFLQELTPLEVITPSTLEAGEVEDILKAIPITPTVKSMLFQSTSCEDPGSKECGDCDRCRRRFRFFIRLFGEDKTKYLKGSKVRLLKKSLLEFLTAKQEKKEQPTWEEIKAIIYPPKSKKDKKKHKKDE